MTNVLTKFSTDWAINEASRVLARQRPPMTGEQQKDKQQFQMLNQSNLCKGELKMQR
ncbi:hypothetical protein DPMN_023498 [Dreissena polymorpha]|uniref:Uncharacterized protein n=1 Tax=Dreissena polymorpha TaxID=45954 RepID=A0A9D4LMT7_DREPO|nr:hypothetical protein DPMN_023498 [Dreissena polymorpha]